MIFCQADVREPLQGAPLSHSKSPDLLPILYRQIEHRCSEVAQTAEPWPCHKGCDHCCRHLSEAPRLVEAEWRRLEEGLQTLSAEDRAGVEDRLRRVAEQETGPVVCPFLNTGKGACRVYDYRPAACRTYGFYQSRGGGLYCHQVEEHVEALESGSSPWDSPIVWGSQEGVDRDLEDQFGPTIGLKDWLDRRS